MHQMMDTPPINPNQPPQAGQMQPPQAGQGQPPMSPEQIKMMMQAGLAPDKNAMVMEQLRGAQDTMGAPAPQGTTNRGVYQAASPLQHIGDFMGKRNASKKATELEGQYEDNLQSQASGREAMYNALIQQLRGGQGG